MGQAISRIASNYMENVEHVETVMLEVTRKVLPPVARYMVEHPLRFAGHALSVLVIAVPTIVSGPLLALGGFTGAGVAGGSIAAVVQSGMGQIQAGGVFASLQSAAMGGYGAATVLGTVSGAAAIAEGVNIAAEIVQHDTTEEFH